MGFCAIDFATERTAPPSRLSCLQRIWLCLLLRLNLIYLI